MGANNSSPSDTLKVAGGRMIAAARARKGFERGRKVRTPQGSVPDNVRGRRLKAPVRPVQQKTYRLQSASLGGKGEMVR